MQKTIHHGLNALEITVGGKPTDIYMYETPSPASIIFVLPQGMGSGAGRTVTFTERQKATHACPTAYQLLAQQRGALVQQVVVGTNPKDPSRDFITVTLHNPAMWRDAATLRAVQTHVWNYVLGRLKDPAKKLVNFDALDAEKNLPQLIAQFKAAGASQATAEHQAVIAIYNMATVGTHGGNIEYVGYEPKSKTLGVYFDSACNTCTSTDATRMGLEAQFKKAFEAKAISVPVASVFLVKEKPKGLHNT